jgi:hypothetical protein
MLELTLVLYSVLTTATVAVLAFVCVSFAKKIKTDTENSLFLMEHLTGIANHWHDRGWQAHENMVSMGSYIQMKPAPGEATQDTGAAGEYPEDETAEEFDIYNRPIGE